MKLFYTATFLLFFIGFCKAQESEKSFAYNNGIINFKSYSNQIIKVTFTPKGYLKNENISDAIILKPSKNVLPKIILKDNSITIGDNFTISNVLQTLEYNGFQLKLKDNEKIFGGGERALPLNRRGYKFNLYNSPWYGYTIGADNLNYSVPFFTSSNGYGILFDNVSKGYVDIGKTNSAVFEYRAVSGELNFYIILGNDYQQILANYFTLTGTQPMPPRWALGNFMSRFGYTDQQQVTDIYNKMKADKIPVDAIIFDLFWFGDSIKKTMGNLDWVNKTKWQNPKKMIADFNKDNVKTLLITEPFVLNSSTNYEASKSLHATDSLGKPFVMNNFYFGEGGLLDLFRNDTKDWFWKKYKTQMDKGVEAWWGDLGEPENHPKTMYHNLKDKGYKRLFNADEIHNAYGHFWTKMLFEKFAIHYPNKRLFSLNRSGFAGTQRYSIFPWTGDVSRSWEGLQAQLPNILGMSMSGVPYVHSDAGGFAGGNGDNELYIRWLQLACYTPIFRPHGTALYNIEPAAFSFPSEPALIAEPFKSIAKKIVEQRYRLLPYNYTLAYLQAIKKEPLIKPIYFLYPNDSNAYKAEDQFFWGKNILVSPIVEKGRTNKLVYLPKGNWYALNTAISISGNSYKKHEASLETIPVFVKAGSFLPTYQKSNYSTTTKLINDTLTVQYYVDDKPSFDQLYLDDGVSKNAIATNKFELINFSTKGLINKSIQIFIKSNGGQYFSKPKKQVLILQFLGASIFTKAFVNNKQVEIKTTSDELTQSITVPFVSQSLSIQLK